jgi:hypothetical protein
MYVLENLICRQREKTKKFILTFRVGITLCFTPSIPIIMQNEIENFKVHLFEDHLENYYCWKYIEIQRQMKAAT